MKSLQSVYFEGDNHVASQGVLSISVHKERLKHIIVGCLVADLQSAHDTPGNRSSFASLVELTMNVLVRIVNRHSDNERWVSSDKNLSQLIIAVMKAHRDESFILASCVQLLDNIIPSACAMVALDIGGLQEIIGICERKLTNDNEVVSTSLTAVNNILNYGGSSSYLKYLDAIYSLNILSATMHILQSPMANDDISVAEAGLTLLATLIRLFGPHALSSHFEEINVVLTGSEQFHNIISDLLDFQVEEALVNLITLYLPYSESVISAAIRVLAVMAPYYEDHPGLLHSAHFGNGSGLKLMVSECLQKHRVAEADIAEDYLTIIFHWTNNLHRSMESLYKLHVNSVLSPQSNLYIEAFRGKEETSLTLVSPALLAQYEAHTIGKGSVLVPSVRSSFMMMKQQQQQQSVVAYSTTQQSHHKVLLERKGQRSGIQCAFNKREYEPFSLLVYHHRLVPTEISTALVVAPQSHSSEMTVYSNDSQNFNLEEETTLIGLLLKCTLELCHQFLHQSRKVAEYAMRIVFRFGSKSDLAWMQILQAGGIGQIVYCIKAHGHYLSGSDKQIWIDSTSTQNLREEILFAEVSSTVLARIVAMIDVARYSRYLIVDLQIMEVVSQYLLSSHAYFSQRVLEHASGVWITLSEFRTASLASQRVDVSACDSAVALLTHYLTKYDTLQQNPFTVDDSEEVARVQDAIRTCLVWIARIVSFDKNRFKLVELNLSNLLQQILCHHFPPNATALMMQEHQNNYVASEPMIVPEGTQEVLVILTLQVIRGLCLGVHGGNILGAVSDTGESTAEEKAMRQMIKGGFIPVLLQILTVSANIRYVRDIVLLSLVVLSVFASRHKIQLGASGICDVLHQLLVYDVTQALNNGIERRGQVDEVFSESIIYICTAIYNMAAKCEENKVLFIGLQTEKLLQQLVRAPFCNPMCKHEIKDAINILRY